MIRQIAPTGSHIRGDGHLETITLTMKKQPVSGSLEKKNKRLGWSKRSVTLDIDAGKFVYSKKSTAEESKFVLLRNVASVRCRGRVVDINRDDGTRTSFRAPTEVDAYSWVQALSMAVTTAKALDRTSPIEKKSVSGLSLDFVSQPNGSPEINFPLTPQSSFSVRTDGSLHAERERRSASFSHPGFIQDRRSPDNQNEVIKKLWERRTLLRRQTQSSSCSSLNDDPAETVDDKPKASGETNLSNAVKSVKRNIIETSNQTTEQNNKMIAFLSGLLSKFLSPLLQVFSKTVRNEEVLELLKNKSGSVPSIVN